MRPVTAAAPEPRARAYEARVRSLASAHPSDRARVSARLAHALRLSYAAAAADGYPPPSSARQVRRLAPAPPPAVAQKSLCRQIISITMSSDIAGEFCFCSGGYIGHVAKTGGSSPIGLKFVVGGGNRYNRKNKTHDAVFVVVCNKGTAKIIVCGTRRTFFLGRKLYITFNMVTDIVK